MINFLVGLRVQLQAALISAAVSLLVPLYNYLHITKPLLVLTRRPTPIWRIKNIGRGAAFHIHLRDIGVGGQKQDYNIYPIGEGEEVELANLKYGDVLEVYFKNWTGRRAYKTTCRKWEQDVERLWFGWGFEEFSDVRSSNILQRQRTKHCFSSPVCADLFS